MEWNAANGTVLKGHYFWGGRPVAFYTTASNGGAATHFEHQDWLGTERMRTAYNASSLGTPAGVEGSYSSLPWGDSETIPGGQDAMHFAGLDTDTESGTDHAQFRQYSPTQGRWLRPDPYAGSYDPGNPQSMNRYVYALNNPLSNIDPSGLDCTEDEGGWLSGAATYCDGGGAWDDVWAEGGGDSNSSSPTLFTINGWACVYLCYFGHDQWVFEFIMESSQSIAQKQGQAGQNGTSAPSKGQTWKEFGQAAKSCAASSFGLSTAAAGGAVAAGTNALSTAGKFAGMTPGTSAASSFFRAVLPQAIESTWAPTLMNPLATSGVLGGVVGRWVPVVGEAILVVQGGNFVSCLWASDDNY